MSGAVWTDANGDLWLFGGRGYDANDQFGDLNDLWEYSPESGQWTWMGGPSTLTCNANVCTSQPGNYGTKGSPEKANIPPGRSLATSWTDTKGRFWLFGGQFMDDSNGRDGDFNDLWTFDPASNLWTWVAGNNTVPNTTSWAGQPGTYGQQGTPSADNTPGARIGPFAWQDGNGNFWIARGWGFDVNDNLGQLLDVWEFNPADSEWTWTAGNEGGETSIDGVYGTLGKPDSGNFPGRRVSQASWIDRGGNAWMFGGEGLDSVGKDGLLNDVWMLNTQSTIWTWMGGNNTIACTLSGQLVCGRPGVYGTEGEPSPSNLPGARSSSAIWSDANGNLWLLGGNGFDSVGSSQGELNDLWEFAISSDTWTWMGGPKTIGCPEATCGNSGSYGTLGSPAATNAPGGRDSAMTWTDTKGNLWLFGGYGFDQNGSIDYLNDLWVYTPVEPGQPTFSFSSSASALSVSSGSQGTLTLTVTPQDGFNSAVSFACSGLPSGATCSFNPATVTPYSGAVTTTLLIAASASASAARPGRNPFLPAAGLALAGCLAVFTRRRALRLWLVPIAALVLFGALSACGGGSNAGGGGGGGGGGTQPTTATVTVTATSGTLQQSTKVSLTIN